MRLIPCLILLLLTLACAIPLGKGSHAPVLERRMVVGKIDPNTLVAVDGSRCAVSAEKYERTERGEEAWCVWRARRAGGGGAGLEP
jgi:hypothetical protein